jgi:hypothetical protein
MIAAIPWREIMPKRRRHYRRAEQTLLFQPPAPTPKWSEVLAPVREHVMALITKMLREICVEKRSDRGEAVDE